MKTRRLVPIPGCLFLPPGLGALPALFLSLAQPVAASPPAIVTLLEDFTPAGDSRSVKVGYVYGLNDAGQVAASGARAGTAPDSKVLVTGAPGNLRVIASSNQPVPNGGGLVFTEHVDWVGQGGIGEDGRLAFKTYVHTDPYPPSTEFRSGMFLWDGTQLQTLCLPGLPGPGGFGNSDQQTAWVSFPGGGPLRYSITWGESVAVYSAPPSQAIYYSGMALPFFGQGATLGLSEVLGGAHVWSNNQGESFFRGIVNVPLQGGGMSSSSGMLRHKNGEISPVLLDDSSGYSMTPALNIIRCGDNGDLVGTAQRQIGGSSVVELIRWRSGVVTVVGRMGDPVPAVPGSAYTNFQVKRIADDGSIYFDSSMGGASGERGLFRWHEGVTTLIARGDPTWGIVGNWTVSPDGKVSFLTSFGWGSGNEGLCYWEPGMPEPKIAMRSFNHTHPLQTVAGHGRMPVSVAPQSFGGDLSESGALGLLNRNGLLALNFYTAPGAMIMDVRTLALGSAPTITNQPASSTVITGASHQLSVSTGGTFPQAYQWKRNGVAISGATMDSLAIEDFQTSDVGRYSVVVTNALGEVTSAPAILKDPSIIGDLPMAFEPFAYPGGETILAKSGGFGFAEAWSGLAGSVTTTQPGMAYADPAGRALHVSGNRLFCNSTATSAQAFRPLPDLSAVGSTLYFSFTGRQLNSSLRASNFAFYGGAAGTTERFAIGHPTGQPATWGFALVGATTDPRTAIPMSESTFLVLRVDLNANGDNERLRLYVNPPLDAEPTTPSLENTLRNVVPDVTFGDLKRIRPFAGGPPNAEPAAPSEWDEFRMGTRWEEVTPFGTFQRPSEPVAAGNPLTLGWNLGAGATQISLQPGNFDVSGQTAPATGIGSFTLPAPGDDTIYTLSFVVGGAVRTLTVHFVAGGPLPPTLPFRFTSVAFENGSVKLEWPAPEGVTQPAGLSDIIQRSTDLGEWDPIQNPSFTVSDGIVRFTDSSPPSGGKVFYRVERE